MNTRIPTYSMPQAALAILAAGFLLRLVYAWNLPATWDEKIYLDLAGQVNLSPGSFSLPMGREVFHPVGAAYLTALGQWLGKGSLFAARLVFILLSMAGLVGIFKLAEALFGKPCALIALFLAAFDRFFFTTSGFLVGSTAYLYGVAWIYYFFFQAVWKEREKSWLYLGLVSGACFMLYGPALMVAAPLAVCALIYRKTGLIFKSPYFYAGAALYLLIISPQVIWSLTHPRPMDLRAVERFSGIGPTIRVLLLYLGDVLVCFKPTAWVSLEKGGVMYLPHHIPCLAAMGGACLLAVAAAFSHVRDNRYGYLLACFFLTAIIPTFVNSKEGWNSFWWAGPTLVPALVLLARGLESLMKKRGARLVVYLFLAISAAWSGALLFGPKYGTALCPEKRFIAQYHLATEHPKGFGIPVKKTLTDRFLKNHPENPLALFYRGLCFDDLDVRKRYLAQALEQDPDNAVILFYLAEKYSYKGDWIRSRDILKQLLEKGHAYRKVYYLIGLAECSLGNHKASEAYSRAAISKFLAPFSHAVLSLALYAQGRVQEAEQALNTYLFWDTDDPYERYVLLALQFHLLGQEKKALWCYGQARKLKPDLDEAPPWITKG